MYVELPKSQKKIARELIQKALQRECKSFLEKVEKLNEHPDWGKTNPHELYLALYKKVKSFDKHVERRYDGLGGSRYFETVLYLYMDEILTTEDIGAFNGEVKQGLQDLAAQWRDEK